MTTHDTRVIREASDTAAAEWERTERPLRYATAQEADRNTVIGYGQRIKLGYCWRPACDRGRGFWSPSCNRPLCQAHFRRLHEAVQDSLFDMADGLIAVQLRRLGTRLLTTAALLAATGATWALAVGYTVLAYLARGA